jgi:hypothetical protein
MSSTSNVQNLLTNVFRPTFVFDTTNGVYQTKLELTNIDSVSANIVYGFTASFGDANGNLYVGIGAGNAYSILAASSNTCNTFIGIGAGGSTSNIKNGVFLGYRSGFGSVLSSNSISIGANTVNGGNSNIYIGAGTGIASGSNNIFLGSGMSNGGTAVSNQLMIGSGSSTVIVGDLSSNRVGINLSALPATTPDLKLDVNGFTRIGTNANGGLGINTLPGYYALDVNGGFRVSDGYGVLTFTNSGSNTVTSISNTASYSNSTATLQVTGGFFSKTGTITVPPSQGRAIGKFKLGIQLISAISSSTIYASRMVLCTSLDDGESPPTLITMNISSSTENILIGAGVNNDIAIVNNSASSATFNYSITYFPLP